MPCLGDSFLKKVSVETDTPLISQNIAILGALKILSGAALYVSGRYHPAIMASLGGVPCVYLGSNSHKTKSLQDLLGCNEVREFSAIPSNLELDEIVSYAHERLAMSDFERHKIAKSVLMLSDRSLEIASLIK